jgi:phosphoribosylcarboxyaminoimidazole (NCAIR) mutase
MTDTSLLTPHVSDRESNMDINLSAIHSKSFKVNSDVKVSKAHKNIQMLKEYEKEQTQKQIEKNIIGQQVKHCRESILNSLNQLDIESVSMFEKEMNKRHLLESIVAQRSGKN